MLAHHDIAIKTNAGKQMRENKYLNDDGRYYDNVRRIDGDAVAMNASANAIVTTTPMTALVVVDTTTSARIAIIVSHDSHYIIIFIRRHLNRNRSHHPPVDIDTCTFGHSFSLSE